MNSNSKGFGKNKVRPDNIETDLYSTCRGSVHRQKSLNNLAVPIAHGSQTGLRRLLSNLKPNVIDKLSPQIREGRGSLKRSTTDTTGISKKRQQQHQYQRIDDQNSIETQRLLRLERLKSLHGQSNSNSNMDLKKSREIFKILKIGVFSDNKNAFESSKNSLKSMKSKQRISYEVSTPLLTVNQKKQLQKQTTLISPKRNFNRPKISQPNLLVITQKEALFDSLSPGIGKNLQQFIPRSRSYMPQGKQLIKKSDTILDAQKQMTIEELRQYLMTETNRFKEKAQYKKQESIMSISRKIKQKVTQHNVDDDNISSDDCNDNAFVFFHMDEEQKSQHLQFLWKKAFIKAKAGSDILRFFNDLARKIYLFGISKNLDEIQKQEKPSRYVLLPTSKFKNFWNIINIVLLVYTATYMPYKLAFLENTSIGYELLDGIVDFLFFMDIIITFFSSFEEKDGTLVHRFPKIAKNYIKSWFFLDFVATFPFQIFEQEKIGGKGANYQKLLRLLRVPRLYRFLKVMKLLKQIKVLQHNRKFQRFLNKLQMNAAIVRMIQGMFYAIIITHVFACLFFLTYKIDDYTPQTWVWKMHLQDADPNIQYLYSLYWSTQTVITVGYGDVHVTTQAEIILSLFWMLFGVAFYSFIIGNYTSIIASNIQIQATIQMRIKGLAELAKKANIPFDLSKKIKKFIENNYESIYNQEDESQLIRMLPPSLRDEVLSNTFGEIIEKVGFFRDMKDPDFLWKLLPLLRPVKLERNDVLYWRGDHAEDRSIKMYTDKGYPYIKYKEGDMFGDSDTLLNLPRDGKAIAVTHLKLLLLKIDAIFEKSFENQEKNLMEMIFFARKKRDLHLKLIQAANKKARKEKHRQKMKQILRSKSQAPALSRGKYNSELQEQNQESNLKSNIFGSIKTKIANIVKSKVEEHQSPISQGQTNENKQSSKFLGIFNGSLKFKERVLSSARKNSSKRLDEDTIQKYFDENNQQQQQPFQQFSNTLKVGTTSQHSKQQSQKSLNDFLEGIVRIHHVKTQSADHVKSQRSQSQSNQRSQSTVKLLIPDKIEELKTPKMNTPKIKTPKIQLNQNNLLSRFNKNLTIEVPKIPGQQLEPYIASRQSVDAQFEIQEKLYESINARIHQTQQTPKTHLKILEKSPLSKLDVPDIIMPEQKKKLSIMEKVLQSAFKSDNLDDIYEMFPFLTKMTSDEIINRDNAMVPKYSAPVLSPRNSVHTNRVLSKESSPRSYLKIQKLDFKSNHLEPMTPQLRRNLKLEEKSESHLNLTVDNVKRVQHHHKNGVKSQRILQNMMTHDLQNNNSNTNTNYANTINDTLTSYQLDTYRSKDNYMNIKDEEVSSYQDSQKMIKPNIVIKEKRDSLKSTFIINEIQFENNKKPRISTFRKLYEPTQKSERNNKNGGSPDLQVQNLSPLKPKDNDGKKLEANSEHMTIPQSGKKQKKGSTRVVVSRPSYKVLRKAQSNERTELNIQRQILSLNSKNTLNNFEQYNQTTTLKGPMTLSPMFTQNIPRARHQRGLTISEKVSQAFVNKQVRRNRNANSNPNQKQQPQVNYYDVKRVYSQQQEAFQKYSFSDAILKFNTKMGSSFGKKEEQEESKSKEYLDQYLLNNQEKDIKVGILDDHESKELMNDMRLQIFEEIKRKFSQTSSQQFTGPIKVNNITIIDQNKNENLEKHVLAQKKITGNFQPIVKEEEIEFYGDPAVVGLVQFNADMNHIALNIFETFQLFDVISKGNQSIFENLQQIEGQNNIIEQRQDNIDLKLNEIEQQLLMIKNLKGVRKGGYLKESISKHMH